MIQLDTWGQVRRPAGTRTRGRLVVRDREVLLLTVASAGVAVERWELGDGGVDLRSKTVATTDGPLRWQASCTCGQPFRLKGPLEKVLEAVSA